MEVIKQSKPTGQKKKKINYTALGKNNENRVIHALTAMGFYPTRAHMSKGEADIVAVRKLRKLIKPTDSRITDFYLAIEGASVVLCQVKTLSNVLRWPSGAERKALETLANEIHQANRYPGLIKVLAVLANGKDRWKVRDYNQSES